MVNFEGAKGTTLSHDPERIFLSLIFNQILLEKKLHIDRQTKWMLAILLLVFIGIAKYTFDKKVSFLGDNATYYTLGKSIAEGSGYTNIHMVEESPANHFPPGYPYIIAATIKLTGAETNGIKVLNYLFLLGSVLLLFFIIKTITSNDHIALITGVICLFNFQLLEYSRVMMSEIPFLFFFILSLFFLLKSKTSFNWKDYNYWLFLLTLVFIFHMRTMGIALLGGAMLYFLINKSWKQLAITPIGFILLCIPWQLRTQSLGGSNHVKNLLAYNSLRPELGPMKSEDWLPRISRNMERYLTKEIRVSLFPSEIDYGISGTALDWIIGIVLIAAIGFGIFQMGKWKWLIGGYCLATFFILLLWPDVWIGPRFIIPLIPIFIFALVTTVQFVASKVITDEKMKAGIVYCSLVMIIPSVPFINQLHEEGEQPYLENQQRYIDLAKWAKENTPKNAVICCRKQTLFYLFSNRKVTPYAFTKSPDEFLQDLIDKGVTHVVFDELGYSSYEEYLFPAAQYHEGKFIYVHGFENHPTKIFELHPEIGYTGKRENGLKHGKGQFIWLDGTRFEGIWKDNMKNGKGTLYAPDGTTLEQGTWKDDQLVSPTF